MRAGDSQPLPQSGTFWAPPASAGLRYHHILGEVLQRDDAHDTLVIVDYADERLAARLQRRHGLPKRGMTVDRRNVALHDFEHRCFRSAHRQSSNHSVPRQNASQMPQTIGDRELTLGGRKQRLNRLPHVDWVSSVANDVIVARCIVAPLVASPNSTA